MGAPICTHDYIEAVHRIVYVRVRETLEELYPEVDIEPYIEREINMQGLFNIAHAWLNDYAEEHMLERCGPERLLTAGGKSDIIAPTPELRRRKAKKVKE